MHRRHDGGEVVVGQHDLGGLLGRLGALAAHGDADIGLLERRRIVDPVAGHRHHRAPGLQCAHHPQLVLGTGAGEHIGLGGQHRQVRIIDRVQVTAFHHHRILGQAELPGDGRGGGGVVAGDHLHRDAGAAAVGDRGHRLGARWIDEADQAQEQQPGHVVLLQAPGGPIDPAHGEAEHALAARGRRGDRRIPVRSIQRHRFTTGAQLPRRQCQQLFRRALGVQLHGAARAAVQGRHVAIAGVERDRIQARPIGHRHAGVDPGPGRQRQQRALHRIPVHPPATLDRVQLRVVAQQSAQHQLAHAQVRLGTIIGLQFPGRRVAIATGRRGRGRSDQVARGHLVAGQGAGLVRTDHRGGTQRLHRRQAPDDGVAGGHAPHADGHGDGDHRQQAFGDHAHGQRHHHHQRIQPWIVARQHREHEQHRCRGDGAYREQAREAVDLPQQRRGQGIDRTDQGIDPADLGGGAGGHHHALRLAGGDQGARIRHATAIAQRRIDRHHAFALVGGHRFAGQGRLVDQQATRMHQAQVGRHAVAGFQQDDVAGHQAGHIHHLPVTAAQHPRGRREHRLQGRQRLFGLALLDEADQGIDQHYRHDHRRVDMVAEQSGQHRRGDQEQDQRVVELLQESAQRRTPRRRRQAVGAMPGQAWSDIVIRQPFGPRVQLLQDLVGAGGVPGRRGRGLHSRLHGRLRL